MPTYGPFAPLNTRVNGDEASVHACAEAVRGVAHGAQAGADAFSKAKNDSEHWWPKGQGADTFRSRMGPMSRGADQIADHATTIARGLDEFGHALAGVKKQMAATRDAASKATLMVSGDYIMHPMSQEPTQRQVQTAAFAEAAQAVQAARSSEAEAHQTLNGVLTSGKVALADLWKQKFWVLGGVGLDGVSRLVEGSRKWSEAAKEWESKAAAWEKDLAKLHLSPGDPAIPKLADAAGRAEAGMAEASTKAASYQAILDGAGIKGDGKFAEAVTRSHLGSLPGTLGSIGGKIPDVGAVFLAGQTIHDVADADGVGGKAQAAGADLGGFAVGSVVTSLGVPGLITLGLAGGPATVVAVVGGGLIGWGVTEAINHL